MPKIRILSAAVLAFVSLLAAAQPTAESDLAQKQLIKQSVPRLLTPCGSIVRITVGINRGKQDPFYAITDPKTIALICDTLRKTIQQDRFQIGRQIHSPVEVQRMVFEFKDKPRSRLKGVSESMFWMAWDKESDKSTYINFVSEEFGDFASEYFSAVDAGPPIPADFALQISRRGCEGKCPSYSVRLDARGTVSWNGQEFVATKGAAKRTISRSHVQAIIQRIKDKRILSFKPSNILCIDTPSTEILVTLDGRSVKLISDSCAWRKTPEGRETAMFSQYAESVMGTEHWIR